MQRRSEGERIEGKILIIASDLNEVLSNVTVLLVDSGGMEKEEEEWRRHTERNLQSSCALLTQNSRASKPTRKAIHLWLRLQKHMRVVDVK